MLCCCHTVDVSRRLWACEGLIESRCQHSATEYSSDPKHRAGSEGLSQSIACDGAGDSSSQPCVAPLLKATSDLFTSQKTRAGKVIHIRCGERFRELSSRMMNNFGLAIRAGVRGETR